MPPGVVNRTLLESYYQNPGQIYDDTMTEGAYGVLADQIDQNYYLVNNLINSGVLSPYLNNALAQAVINGGFIVNQRVKTGTVVLAAGAYGHDRFKAGASGCTYTFATVNNVTTITILSGSLLQIIEGINIFSGNYTLSWAGTSQGRINSGSYGASGVSALLTGGNNTTIEFGVGTLSNVQFNYGSDILPFQPRLTAVELMICRRYYRKSYAYDVTPGTATDVGAPIYLHGALSSGYHTGYVSFDTMRVPPTVRIWDRGGNIGKISTFDAAAAPTHNVTPTAGPGEISNTSFRVAHNGNISGISFHYECDSEI